MLSSQTFYGLLFSYLTITDVTSYIHHKFPVSFVLYIATKILNQIITVNSSANAPITHKKNNSRMLCVPMFLILKLLGLKPIMIEKVRSVSCIELENLTHLFWFCPITSSFWQKFKQWLINDKNFATIQEGC